jgi:hypothetical protein
VSAGRVVGVVAATAIVVAVVSVSVVLGRQVLSGAMGGVAVMPMAAMGRRLRHADREAQGEAAQADQQQLHRPPCSVPAHR